MSGCRCSEEKVGKISKTMHTPTHFCHFTFFAFLAHSIKVSLLLNVYHDSVPDVFIKTRTLPMSGLPRL